MATILDLLNTDKGEKFIARVSEKTSESKEQVTALMGMVLPLLLGSMLKNIHTDEGKESLDSALNQEKHGEDFLSNLEHTDPAAMTSEGGKILDHILGGQKDNVINTLAGAIQMKTSSITAILYMTAPLLMSILGTQKKKEQIDASGLENLLSSVMGASGKFDSSLIEAFLDKDNDGNILNDVKSMILGGTNGGKKEGGILGGMLGGK